MQGVEQCFADAAAMNDEHYVKEDRESEELGMVFYFCPVITSRKLLRNAESGSFS